MSNSNGNTNSNSASNQREEFNLPKDYSNNVNKVADHYNNKDKTDLAARSQSRIFYLRNFNNWIKSVLINQILKQLPACNRQKMNVLDLGCGRGGDMIKWIKAHNNNKINRITFSDLAQNSLDECKSRYDNISPPKFEAEFIQLDATRGLLSEKIDTKYRDEKYDIVSSQFVIHYSFESYDQACRFLENVSENLKPGGYFFGCTTNSNELIKRLRKSETNSFGNEIYEIRFYQDGKDEFDLFGVKFDFRLDGVVECPEFLLNFNLLEKLAHKFGLKLVFKKTFNEFFYEHHKNPEYANLISVMQALEPFNEELSSIKPGEYDFIANELKQSNESKLSDNETFATLSKSEWEAITLYLVFAFVKVDNFDSESNIDNSTKVSTTNTDVDEASKNDEELRKTGPDLTVSIDPKLLSSLPDLPPSPTNSQTDSPTQSPTESPTKRKLEDKADSSQSSTGEPDEKKK